MHRLPVVLMMCLAVGLAAASGMGAGPAWAACGGGPCSCGSVVDSNTTLDALVDSVCSTDPADTCPGNGLSVDPGVILDLGGCTLRGAAGSNTGVGAGAGATVRNGRIIGFGGHGVVLFGDGGTVSNLQISEGGFAGVRVAGDSNRVEKVIVRNHPDVGVVMFGHGNVVSGVQALDNFRGVEVQGNGNTVEKTNAHRNGGWGIILIGDDNTARSNNVQHSGVDGVFVGAHVGSIAHNAVVANNTSLYNGRCGLNLSSVTADAAVSQNQVRYNQFGICLGGTRHTVSLNVVSGSASDGFSVGATGSLFARNSSKANGGFGIRDIGFDNTYDRNICTGNGAGASDPIGLCK